MLRSPLERAALRLVAIVLVGSGGGPGLAHCARHLLRDSRKTVHVHRRRDGAQHACPVDKRSGRWETSTGSTGTTAAAPTAGTRTCVRFVCRGIIERTADRVSENAADCVQDRFRRARVPFLVTTVSKLERVRRLFSFWQQQHRLNGHNKMGE